MKPVAQMLLISVLIASVASAEPPFSDLSFDDACTQAEKDSKVVMIDFYITWCGPCKLLDRTTWKDEKVRAWLKEKTIPLKIDAEKNRKLAARFKVRAYPTITFAKPDGTVIDQIIGYRDAKAFLAAGNDALSGKDSLTRAREKVEQGNTKNPMVRLDYARELVNKGKHKEALKEFLWCFDHGHKHRPSFVGVRGSFLLSDISRLGQSYPPAIEALKKRRDKAGKAVLSELDGKNPEKRKKKKKGLISRLKGSFQPEVDEARRHASDFASLNRQLDERDRTLKLYDDLSEGGERAKKIRRILADDVLNLLLEQRRYADILRDCEVEHRLEFRISMQKNDVSRMKNAGDDQYRDVAEYARRRVFALGGQYYEAAIGGKNKEQAKAILDMLTEFDDCAELYAALLPHALRAGGSEAVQHLMAIAQDSLSEKEFEELEAVREDLPE